MRGRTLIVLAAFLAIAGFFLWSEHRAHILGLVPYALVLACPLLHLFHGHGDHGAEPKPSQTSSHPHDHGQR